MPGFSLSQVEIIRELPDGLKIESSSAGISLRLNPHGYWSTARFQGVFYRRCLNGDVCTPGTNVSNKYDLESISGAVSKYCQLLLDDLAGISIKSRGIIEKAASRVASDYVALADIYADIYPESVPVLPPDRYRDLVVPLTTGCPNGQCTFCAFYQGRPFKVLDGQVLNRRLDGLLALLPSGLAGREGLFLGSANALAIPVSRLQEQLSVICERLGKPKRGVSCFGDADYMGRRSRMDWDRLQVSGLEQVIVGLESGNPDLRGRLGKRADLTKTTRLVEQLKGAGIRVGLTVLTGVCQSSQVQEHFDKTSQFIQSLNLSHSDRVYISPWFDDGVLPSQQAEVEAKHLLALLKESSNARINLYSSHNFHYFS